ncbi:hypothetical protein [Nostoc sp.]
MMQKNDERRYILKKNSEVRIQIIGASDRPTLPFEISLQDLYNKVRFDLVEPEA